MAGYFDSLTDSAAPEEASQEDFLKQQLEGSAPQYDPQGGFETAKGIAKTAATLTPPGAAAEAMGYMGEPSAWQNVKEGNYGTAALQAAGLIPGIGWLGKAARGARAAGRAGRAAREASAVAPEILEGEILSPAPQLSYRPAEAAAESSSDPFFGIQRTDRTREWRDRVFQDPRLNPNAPTMAEERSAIAAGREAAPEAAPLPKAYDPTRVAPTHVPSVEDFTPKSRAALLRLLEQQKSPTAFEQNYLSAPWKAGRGFYPADVIAGPREVGGMNTKIYDVLMRAKLGGKPLTPFEQNMVNNYMASFEAKPTLGIHGANSSGEIGPPKVRDTTLPPSKFEQNWRASQKAALDRWREEHGMRMSGVMPRNPRYQAYLEEELPVPYKPKEVLSPVVEQAAKQGAETNPFLRRALAVSAGVLGPELGSMAIDQATGTFRDRAAYNDENKKHILPDMNVLAHKPATGPTLEDIKPVVAKHKPEPAAAPHRAAPARHAAPKRAPAKGRAAADSGQRYYGDWRDTEPFASDPIGGFIDELTGQRKTARKPGKLERGSSPMNLGDLLPFSEGGMVRKHYEDGGSEDRIPVVSDIADAVGGMFGGGDQGVVAQDAERAPRQAAEPSGGGMNDFFERWSTNPLSQFLFATGIGAMASDRVNPLQALGEGGIRGLEYMRAAQSAQADLREKERERADMLRQQRLIEQTLGSPDTDIPPMKTAEGEPEVAAPVKTAAATPPETPVVAPEAGAPAAQPETQQAADALAEKKIAKEAEKVSTDEEKSADPTANLYSLHRKISNVMSAVTDPKLRLALANRQKAVEFEIQRIEKQRSEAAVARQRAEDRAIRQAQEKRLEEQQSPEHKTKMRKAEELGKRLDETEATINAGAQGAQGLIDQFDVYKNAIKSGQVVTGAYGEDRLNAHKTLLGLTSGITGKNTDLRSRLSDNIKAGALQQAFAELGGRLGAGISDADRRAIQQMGISLDRDPESNIDAIETFQNAQRRKLAAAEFMEDYKANKSSVPGQLDAGFEAAFTKWVNSQPSIVPDRMKNILAGDEKGIAKKESGPTVVATGTKEVDGKVRKVVKYSDGTVKYAD